jgi:tripartite-type tricarboxylate transporter receptor subunit TctC
MHSTKLFLSRLATTVGITLFASVTFSANYPTRPIRLVVPYLPGGGADIVGRLTAKKIGDGLKMTVVVDNRPGAGGNLGTDMVAKAIGDGYTLLLGNVGPIAINPSLYSRLPYDPFKDFATISLLAVYPNLLVINPALPPISIQELVSYAKAHPRQLSYGSSGVGSSTHLAAELLHSITKIDIVHVPYKGGAQALVELMGGQIQLFFSSILGALPHVKNGKIRALAVTSAKRSNATPELPTVAESGYPGYEASNWQGLLAPIATPSYIVKRLNLEIVSHFREPDVRENLATQGGDVETGTSEAFTLYIRAEFSKWARVVKESGARAE